MLGIDWRHTRRSTGSFAISIFTTSRLWSRSRSSAWACNWHAL